MTKTQCQTSELVLAKARTRNLEQTSTQSAKRSDARCIAMNSSTKKASMGLARYLRFQFLVWGMIGGLALISAQTAVAQCTSMLKDGDFEEYRERGGPWFAEGKAGIDRKRGLSYRGDNNAWIKNSTGWNAIKQRVNLSAGKLYTLTAFVHTSQNVSDGYFGFRDTGQHPVSEIKFGSLSVYKELRVQFRPTRTASYYIFVGFWAPNQDAWVLVDNMHLDGPCQDVNAVPGDE